MSDQDRIQQLEQLVRELQDELKRTKDELDAWKRGHRIRSGQKLPQQKKTAPRLEERSPGRKKGHVGAGRPAPESLTRLEEVFPPKRCPDCRTPLVLSEPRKAGLHRVEDIVPAQLEVIGYRRHIGWCQGCRKSVRAPLPDGLGKHPKIGVRAQATLVQAKAELGLTTGQLCRMMKHQYGLTISKGGVQQILHRAASVLEPGLEEIQHKLRESQVAWADETPWKIWGTSAYMWMVLTKDVVWFESARSRGKEVPQRMLQGFFGILHSDFYAAYYAIEGLKHAACWAHLIREARQLSERESIGSRAKRFYEGLQGVYREASVAQQTPASAKAEALRLRGSLKELECDEELGRHKEVKRLQGRLGRHRDNLLRFVENGALEGTNNRAERELRMLAMMRHVSSGGRSEAGGKTLATLLSVHRTLKKHGKVVGPAFLQARKAWYQQAEFPRLTPSNFVN